jgi:hypothetical protein
MSVNRPHVNPLLTCCLILIAGLAVSLPTTAAQMISGLGGADNFGALALSRNDDGSSAEIPLGTGFPNGANFFGNTYQSLYINNNGNVTFRGPLPTYTPVSFPVSTQPMIAPYWGDVDTRSAAVGNLQNNVYYAQVGNQFIVTWDYVGYYAAHADKLNAFQLVLTDRSDVGAGDFDVEYRYQQLQWTTGDASGGSAGLGGVPAQMGFDAGDGKNFYKHPDSLTANILNLVTTSNVSEPGVWRFQVRGGVIAPAPNDVLTNVNVVARLPAGVDVDPASFALPPLSTQVVSGQTVVTWHFDTFVATDTKNLDFDVIVRNPIPGEQRQVSYDLELSYVDINGHDVSTALGPQYLAVLPSIYNVAVATDQPAYDANQQVAINVQVGNLSQFPATATAHLLIVDGSGATVADLGTAPALTLAPGQSQAVSGFTFFTGTTIAGGYSVRVDLLDAAQHLVAQASAPFQIRAPSTLVTATIASDKPNYQAWDTVVLTSRLRNVSANTIEPPMTAQLSVSGPGGGVIYSTTYSVNSLVPGALSDLTTTVHLSDASGGTYSVQLIASDATTSAVVATASGSFQVTRSDLQALSGTVIAQSPSVFQGSSELCTDTITNLSATALAGVTLARTVVSLDTQAVLQTTTQIFGFTQQQQQTILDSVTTGTLSPGAYGCVLTATYNGSTRQLGSAGFRVLPPPIQIDASLSVGSRGRLLVLMDADEEGPCGHVRDEELWAPFHTSLPADATIDVELHDRTGNLIDHESVTLANYRGSVNRSPGKDADLIITGVSADVLTVEVRAASELPTGLRITATVKSASLPPIVLDSRPMGSSAGWPVLAGARFGDFTSSEVHPTGAPVTPSSKNGPTLTAQRAFLENLLQTAGWSYRIVTEEEDFEREFYSGAYSEYALLARRERLDEHTRQALREAVFRGEGLLYANAEDDDESEGDLNDALGIKVSGELPHVSGIEMFDPTLGASGTASFAFAEDAERVALSGAQELGRFQGVRVGNDRSRAPTPLDTAVSAYSYGMGKSIYVGYNLLAEATQAGGASLHATILQNGLEYVKPSWAQLHAGQVVPLHVALVNKGVATPGQVQLTLPAGVTLIDPGTAQVNGAILTWTFSLTQSQQLGFDFWVRLPGAAGSVTFDALVQTGTSGAYVDYTHAKLTLTASALATLADAQALAASDRAFQEVREWLNQAQYWLGRGRNDFAFASLLEATEELTHCTSSQTGALRLQIDQVIWAVSKTL